MWQIRKFSRQLVLELMTTRMIDVVLNHRGYSFCFQTCWVSAILASQTAYDAEKHNGGKVFLFDARMGGHF